MPPSTLELAPAADAAVMEEIMTDLHYLCWAFREEYLCNPGYTGWCGTGEWKTCDWYFTGAIQAFQPGGKIFQKGKLIRSLARQQSIKSEQCWVKKEMRHLVQDLFACEQPNISPDGNPTYLEFKTGSAGKDVWEVVNQQGLFNSCIIFFAAIIHTV